MTYAVVGVMPFMQTPFLPSQCVCLTFITFSRVFFFSPRQGSRANLNQFPFYLGQPPGYVSSQRSASGYLWGASTYADALTVEQVRRPLGFPIYCCILPVFVGVVYLWPRLAGTFVSKYCWLCNDYVLCYMYVKDDDYPDLYPA